jgi:branched-chain amino acid transport system substrate-binding protein
MGRGRWSRFALLAGVLAALAGGATAGASVGRDAHQAKDAPWRVGVVYSRTGLLAAYGAEYVEGLKIGLDYATNGTDAVNGHKVLLSLVDDGTDPTKAVSAAKSLIGQGYKIIIGSVSSGVALQVAPIADQNNILYISGPAASDAITGINKHTFRSGRQTTEDVLAANSFLQGSGKKVVVFAQDSAFGNGNFAAVNALLGGKGHKVSKIVVPLSANDFTPFAQQVKESGADLVFVAWAGSTAPAMWKALQQQGVFGGSTKVVTGLAEKATWPTFGPVASDISFLSHYVWTAPKNAVNDYLVKRLAKRGQTPDLFTPDGFVAAQMVVHAIQAAKGDQDVDKMISSLEGWKFTGPKGPEFIRPEDHALLQPMFQVKLQAKGSGWVPVVLKRISPGNVVPPVVKH